MRGRRTVRWLRSSWATFSPPRESRGDTAFRTLTGAFAALVVGTLLYLVYEVFTAAWPALSAFGPGFLTSEAWDHQAEAWGAWPFIWGTLYTSLIALALAVPVSLGVALFLSEFSPKWLRLPLGTLVELLAGIPSIVYGLWGFFVLVPWIRTDLAPWMFENASWIPMVEGQPGVGNYLAGGIVLAIMILPTITAISRDALMAVPRDLREAAYALGATRWEVARRSVVPSARVGLVGATILGLGRALGETIAVTLVIGNATAANTGLFDAGSTLPSILVNQFGEAHGTFLGVILALGLILLGITLLVNVLARILLTNPRLLTAPFRFAARAVGRAFRGAKPSAAPRGGDGTRLGEGWARLTDPLRRALAGPRARRTLDVTFRLLGVLAVAVAVGPLAFILYYVGKNGGPTLFGTLGFGTNTLYVEGWILQDVVGSLVLAATGAAAAFGILHLFLKGDGASRKRTRLANVGEAIATWRGLTVLAFGFFLLATFFVGEAGLGGIAILQGALLGASLGAMPKSPPLLRRGPRWLQRRSTVALFGAVVIALTLYGAVEEGNYLTASTLTPFDWTVFVNYPWIQWPFLTDLPAGLGQTSGGIYHAIVGSLYAVGIAAAIGVPTGLLAGIFLAEYARGSVAALLRNGAEVLAATPSILIGLFGYIVFVQTTGAPSILAGGLTLSVMVAPVVMRTTELALRSVPLSLREAGVALGAPYWRTLLQVVLPAAKGPLATGCLLSMSRVGGETAPLLFTALYSEFLLESVKDPSATLPTLIWEYYRRPFDANISQAWAAALLLVLFVLIVNLGVRAMLGRTRQEA